ncbi:MAG: hypothetical protein E7395_03690 [Ruminococcaceae bacterium]|nr:hypothetical protein [Oscillospiraceae bacterium]
MGKKIPCSQKCLQFSDELFAQKDKLHVNDFVKKIALDNLESHEGWNTKSSSEQSKELAFEMDYISSTVRKALSKLHLEGKIGRIGKCYISVANANLLKAEDYLYENLKPSQKSMKKISQGTYVISIEKEEINNYEDFCFSKKYDGNLEKIETDLMKVIEFMLKSEKEKTEKEIKYRKLTSYLKDYIGKEYCYDVLRMCVTLFGIVKLSKGY